LLPDSNVINQESIFRKAWNLSKKYLIESDERYKAWLLLLGTLILILSMVGLQVVFAWSMNGFWAALSSKSWVLFGESIGVFCGVLFVQNVVGYVKDYFLGVLYANWKASLLKYFSDKNFKDDNYLRMKRENLNSEIPILNDVDTFVKTTLYRGSYFLNTVFKLISFTSSLWIVGGGISFVLGGVGIFIPGYLVWIAIIFALSGTYISHKIGKPLSETNKDIAASEANFNKERSVVEQQAENIALEKGEEFHSKSETAIINSNEEYILESNSIKVLLERFQYLYSSFAGIFPYIAAAPLYFVGQIEMGELMQIGYAFGEVFDSLNWFSDNYVPMLTFRDAINRLSALDYHLNNNCLSEGSKINFIPNPLGSENIHIQNLTFQYPNSTSAIFNGTDVTFKKGEHTVIKGNAGSGKSTLFKVLAKTYQNGSGDVYLPNESDMCFLAQTPVLFKKPLKAMLAYPDTEDKYEDGDYERVLAQVLMDDFIKHLFNEPDNGSWFDNVSPGQKQKIALARALLKKPKWLFLDEATASLDDGAEKSLYELIQSELPETTIVSIAHKPSVEQYHRKTLIYYNGLFKLPEEMLLNEQPLPFNTGSLRASV